MLERRFNSKNIRSFVGGVLVIIAGIAIVNGGLNFDSSETAEVSDSFIEHEAAKVIGKSRTIVLTSEKSAAVRDAIKRGDYASAQKSVDEVLSSSQMQYWGFSPFSSFIDSIVTHQDSVLLENLDRWIEKDSNSAIAYLIRAKYYYKLAWQVRGENFISQTQKEHVELFKKYISMAESDVRKSIGMNGNNPDSYVLLLNIMASNGNSPQMEQEFQASIVKFPDYYQLYKARLGSLEPNWGGSVEEMKAFINKYAGSAKEFSPLKLLYVRLYANLLNVAELRCERIKSAEKKSCVSSIMSKIVDSELEKNVHDALYLYNHTDKYQFSVALEGILRNAVSVPMADEYSGTLVHLAAQAMDSDSQLVKDNTKHNNFMLDKITAYIWYRDKFYENAEQKYKEALTDIEYMDFPNEEEKYLQLASIYRDLSDVYEKTKQYSNMAVYQSAALAAGGRDYSYSRCNAYYQLKKYKEAVKECTQQYNSKGGLHNIYWLANANEKLGNIDEAIKYFTVIADSEYGFRTSAAIELSVIYFKINNLKNALNSLNSHLYLFDERSQSKIDLAVSYNNRCYAYMKLGELQKALDDCSSSLKYGNIPDAYQKQQEIIKKLNEQKNRL